MAEEFKKLITNPNLVGISKGFQDVIQAMFQGKLVDVSAIQYGDFCKAYPSKSDEFFQEMVIVLRGNYKETEQKLIESRLGISICQLSNNVFGWGFGDVVGGKDIPKQAYKTVGATSANLYDKGKDWLPNWLDKYIFGELGARYNPDHVRFEYNLNLNADESRTYLGTYFPRSYMEAWCIVEKIFRDTSFAEVVSDAESISVLDVGCGTGGEIFGLLDALHVLLPGLKTVRILAIDGNHNSLRLFQAVMEEYKKHSSLMVEYRIGPATIADEQDLRDITKVFGNKFECILSFKSICEIISKRRFQGASYKTFARILANYLTEKGVLIIEDVTVKTKESDKFLPELLTKELNEFCREEQNFATILPRICRQHYMNCLSGCFMKETVYVSHSHKQQDKSNIVYRVIARHALAESLEYKVFSENINCKEY